MGFHYIDKYLSGYPSSKIKRTRSALDSDSYVDGDIVEIWDHVFRWDSDCVPESVMSLWQHKSDDLADNALPVLRGSAGDEGGTDLLARLRVAAEKSGAAPEVTALWHQVNRIDRTVFAYDRDQIKRGQAVFWRYAPQFLASLLHFSLAGGFSSPRISRVLNLASYLSPPMNSTPHGEAPRITQASSDRSYKRLLETIEFFLDCMGDQAMEVGGKGWAATVRVRLLHTTMRRRLLDQTRYQLKTKGHSIYDTSKEGVPISQEDMVGTLTSFAAVPLICLQKYGVTPSQQECEDWTALWQVIGYYLGIDETILANYFSSYHLSTRIFCSTLINLAAQESDPPPPCQFPFASLVPEQNKVYLVKQPKLRKGTPDPYKTPSTLPVLFCVCNRWPLPLTFAQHCAGARLLIGDPLSNWLSVPRTPWTTRVELWVIIRLLNFPSHFARAYRSGWDAKRRSAMQRSIEDAVVETLGNRQTKFRPRLEGQWEPVKEGDEFLGKSVAWGLGTTLEQWGILYVEMAAVLLVLGSLALLFLPLVAPGIVMYYCWSFLRTRFYGSASLT